MKPFKDTAHWPRPHMGEWHFETDRLQLALINRLYRRLDSRMRWQGIETHLRFSVFRKVERELGIVGI